MIPGLAMGKRKLRARDGRPAEVDQLVWDLTGLILQKAERNGWTDEKLSQKARHNASVLYGYRNGNRQSPSLLVLRDFAAAVGLTFVLSDATQSHEACGRPHVTSDFEKNLLVAVRALTDENDKDELLTMVRDYVLAHTSGSRGPPSGPPVPVERAGE